MWRRPLLFVQLGLIALAMLAGQACFEEHYSAPYPAYGYYGTPAVPGDWDDDHTWHDRDWWVDHNHSWVQEHHHEWLKHHEAEEHEHGHS